MIFVYILKNSFNDIYIGSTNNLKRRIFEHKNKLCSYTKSWDSVCLEAYFVINDNKKGRDLEFYLKRGSGRAFLKKRILTDEA